MQFRKLVNSLKFSYKFDDDLPRKFVKKILLDSEDSSKFLVDTIQQSIDDPPKIKIKTLLARRKYFSKKQNLSSRFSRFRGIPGSSFRS